MTSWREDREKARVYDSQMERGWSKVFPGISRFEPTPDGSDEQKAQIDRYAYLPDGRRVALEEKVRYRPFEGDVLIELDHKHKDGTVTPGWIQERMDCEYIGYLWVPSLAFVVIPALMLQSFWREQVASRQVNTHRLISAKNDTYTTRCAIINMHRLPCAVFNMLESDTWKETI